MPAWIDPGHAQESITIGLGFGRRRAGRVGTGVGVDAYALRGSDAPWIATGDAVKAGGTHQLVSTQDHWSIEGRNLVRSAQLEEYKSNPKFAHEMEHMKLSDGLTLYPKWEYSGYAWGMAIDLNTCTGCNACVVACQAENNIPVVGKDQVANGREMQWLRIDRYYSGDLDSPDTYYQPMPCQQCENAPCEVVCPVSATVHSDEGLNDMVYNRCVGTRYCSNNCPWKVRRFNFTLYQDWETPQFKLQRNPDVTVRSRGIMEKCTYCVQRINSARIQAKREDREIRDGEVVTACESACPTQAITFGNLNDPTSRVAKLKASPRNYSMLAELNTRPRTTYLAAGAQRQRRAAGQSDRRRQRPRRQTETHEPTDATERGGALDGEQHERRSAPPIRRRSGRRARSPGRSGAGQDYETITEAVAQIPLSKRTPFGWVVGFLIGLGLLSLLQLSIGWLLLKGVYIWGNNVPVGWAFDIINFVWWIGIGHAGTLISAILLLFKQQWRMSISRFAEAMTIFAVACAAIFPIFHTGRPWLAAYWLFPYPNTMGLWPQFRSPLIWDVFAVSTYATVSVVFWIVGLIPDLATMRDRATSAVKRRVFGILALGWRGSARHWHRYEVASLILAGLSTPLVLSVHSVVSFDFAVLGAARLARDDLPALLRRRRHLLGLRHGAHAGHPDPRRLQARAPDHDEAHRQHGQGHAGDRADRRLRLRHGSVLRLVQRQPVRALHAVEPHDRALRLVLLAAHLHQRGADPRAVVQARPLQPGG